MYARIAVELKTKRGTWPAKMPHTPIMTRTLKTAEPTMVPTPTSPLVMNTPVIQTEGLLTKVLRDSLNLSGSAKVKTCGNYGKIETRSETSKIVIILYQVKSSDLFPNSVSLHQQLFWNVLLVCYILKRNGTTPGDLISHSGHSHKSLQIYPRTNTKYTYTLLNDTCMKY